MVWYFHPEGRILEPAAGEGAFLSALPGALWCEVDHGRDFFLWQEPVDWIISNPPYSKTRRFFQHAMTLAPNVVFLVPLRNIFSGYGFVADLYRTGGLRALRVYGTGGRLGFPMGNAIGAVYWQRGYTGFAEFSFYATADAEEAERPGA